MGWCSGSIIVRGFILSISICVRVYTQLPLDRIEDPTLLMGSDDVQSPPPEVPRLSMVRAVVYACMRLCVCFSIYVVCDMLNSTCCDMVIYDTEC